MTPTKRIIVNTLAQYIKAVLSTILSLYSTRLILDALTITDYGIYAVIGGVIAMLGFITNALVITTQRYISFYHGKGNYDHVKSVFCNSLFLHILIGVGICAVLLVPKDWIIYFFLNIPSSRLQTAEYVYIITVIVLFITILTSPFKALFIARESIVFIAVVESADAIIKLLFAIALGTIQADKLQIFATLMGCITLLNLGVYVIYALFNFKECSILIRRKDINKSYLKQLLGFAGWTTYGMGAVAARNQGTAVILNHFFGTAINAAYGIAFQIYGAIAFVVTSILNAMNPQIMKAEGEANRERMLLLACQESKFSAILLAVVTIPLIFEMPAILSFWLKEVPPYTDLFCRFVLIGFICDQLTMGLQTANQAIGNIRNYTLLIYTPKLIYLPIIWLMLKEQYSIRSIMYFYLFIEVFVAMIRIPYLKAKAHLDIKSFIQNYIFPIVPICLTISVIAYLCTNYLTVPYRFIFTYILSFLCGIWAAWYWGTNTIEKEYIRQSIRKKKLL